MLTPWLVKDISYSPSCDDAVDPSLGKSKELRHRARHQVRHHEGLTARQRTATRKETERKKKAQVFGTEGSSGLREDAGAHGTNLKKEKVTKVSKREARERRHARGANSYFAQAKHKMQRVPLLPLTKKCSS